MGAAVGNRNGLLVRTIPGATAPHRPYWSSSTAAVISAGAWVVYFSGGNVDYDSKTCDPHCN